LRSDLTTLATNLEEEKDAGAKSIRAFIAQTLHLVCEAIVNVLYEALLVRITSNLAAD
jgi:hypothetical protein